MLFLSFQSTAFKQRKEEQGSFKGNRNQTVIYAYNMKEKIEFSGKEGWDCLKITGHSDGKKSKRKQLA